ncbi:MAG: hypothetical protein WBM87_06210, partial [Woeseiaceae bacterium]
CENFSACPKDKPAETGARFLPPFPLAWSSGGSSKGNGSRRSSQRSSPRSIVIVRLFPFPQCELEKKKSAFLDALFSGNFKIRKYERLRQQLPQRIVAGGYPAAMARNPPRRRSDWYRDYVDAIVQRDVRDLARIASLDVLLGLLTLVGGQTSRLLNISELAGSFQISRPTIREHRTVTNQLRDDKWSLTRMFLRAEEWSKET